MQNKLLLLLLRLQLWKVFASRCPCWGLVRRAAAVEEKLWQLKLINAKLRRRSGSTYWRKCTGRFYLLTRTLSPLFNGFIFFPLSRPRFDTFLNSPLSSVSKSQVGITYSCVSVNGSVCPVTTSDMRVCCLAYAFLRQYWLWEKGCSQVRRKQMMRWEKLSVGIKLKLFKVGRSIISIINKLQPMWKHGNASD